MTEPDIRLTRSGKRVYDYLMQGHIRTRNDEDQNDQSNEPEEDVAHVAKKAKKIPRILDGTFYIIESNVDGKISAKCQQCGEIRKGCITSTGNFKSHYKKHPKQLKELDEYLKQEYKDSSDDSVERQKSGTQPRIEEMLSKLAPVNEEKVASKIVDFVVEGNLSFNISQLPSLQSLLETVGGRKVIMPSRRKFMNQLESKFDELKSTLKNKLKEIEFLCVTCDVWSSRAQSFLGVTVHYLNENFERESYLLAFKRLYARQTYLHLANELDGIFKDFDIDVEKITHIVTDGGSAFCKMFKEFGNLTDAVIQDNPEDEYDDSNFAPTNGSDQHASANDTSEGDSSDTVQPFMQTEIGELFQHATLNFSDYQDNQVDDDYLGSHSINEQPQLKLPKQRRCYSHLANLASQDFEKMLPTNADKAFKQTYNKLHALWNTTNRSSYAKMICKDELGCLLKTPCETRWNSKFDSILKVFDICKLGTNLERNKINVLIRRLRTELRSAAHLLTLEIPDLVVMENYVKVMQPVACALDTLQGEYNCSQGLIMTVLISMKHRISSLEDTCNLLVDFKRTMQTVIEKRFGNCLKFTPENKYLIISAISHPKIKTDFIEDDDDFNFAKQMLVAECKKYKTLDIDNENGSENIPQSNSEFFVRFNSRRFNRSNSIESEIESEVSAFLSSGEIEYTLLNRHPLIRKIFFKYNTTLSSSAAVERVFSQSMMIFTPRRNRISAENFEKTLFLKINTRMISKKNKE